MPGQFPYAVQLFLAGCMLSLNVKKRKYLIPRLCGGGCSF